MKTIIRKAYWNYEKEEEWLNEMSAKGLALTDYSWCRYVFTDSLPGEYIYRIQLLENPPSHPASQKYLRFIEENGVEHIASYMRWVYFRKKASDGAFDIYSDIDSKIKHYQRINQFWVALSSFELIVGLWVFFSGIGLLTRSYISFVQMILGGICFFIGIGYFILSHPLRKKIRRLKKDKLITE